MCYIVQQEGKFNSQLAIYMAINYVHEKEFLS